ncbi:RNA polymerase sigma factor [Acidobacteriota bacterium]
MRERKTDHAGSFEGLLFHQKKVFLICLGFTRNPTDAEDLTQDIYLKAFRRIHSLKESRLSNVWLYRITRNTCLDFLKKHRPIPLTEDEMDKVRLDPSTPESNVAYTESLRLLKSAIHQLPGKQREVYVLKEYGDLTYAEIVDVLKIPEGTVMSRLNRARQAIKSQMSRGDSHE